MKQGQVLTLDNTRAEYMYFFVSGVLMIKKDLNIEQQNTWPSPPSEETKQQQWCQRKVTNHYMCTVNKLQPFKVIGMDECLLLSKWPCQLVADQDGTHLFMLPKQRIQQCKLQRNFTY